MSSVYGIPSLDSGVFGAAVAIMGDWRPNKEPLICAGRTRTFLVLTKHSAGYMLALRNAFPVFNQALARRYR
jgi:hypothetical protein